MHITKIIRHSSLIIKIIIDMQLKKDIYLFIQRVVVIG